MILNGFNHFKIIFQIKFVLELTKLKNSAHIYSVYEKKLYPLKFKLSASYCVKLTGLNASNKWSVKTQGLIIKFQCVQDLLFLRIINSKQSELSN